MVEEPKERLHKIPPVRGSIKRKIFRMLYEELKLALKWSTRCLREIILVNIQRDISRSSSKIYCVL
uniref:Uncharacterized protein n=1 Tax=Kalanchoe fedtschenkoi TaxID=63787 RepID=A0A7N0UAQ6_KALFE